MIPVPLTDEALAVALAMGAHTTIKEGRVDMAPMIACAFLLSRARGAFELASDRKRAMKVLLDFSAVPG